LIKDALTLGPQEISVHGRPAVIVIDKKEYDRLTQKPIPFAEFLAQSPLAGVKI